MALAETAELAVKLSLDNSQMLSKIGQINSRLGAFSGALNRNLGHLVDAGIYRGVNLLTDAFTSGVAALKEDAVVAAQTAAVIKSTGGAAGVTAQQVADLAHKLSMLNGVQDNVVQGAENVILRFTNIGSKIFPAVTQAAIDTAAATGTDAATAALKLSRALDNPLKSLGALSRLGITFTAGEEKQIKDLVAHNKLLDAQAIILAKVQKAFGGVAEQQANADPSRRLNVAIEELNKAFAKGLLPTVETLQRKFTALFNDPRTMAAAQQIGDALGAAADQVIAFVETVPWDKVGDGLRTAADFAGKLIHVFASMPPEVQGTIIALAGLNKLSGGAVTHVATDIAGGVAGLIGKALGSGIKKIFAAEVTVVGANVTGVGGGAGGLGGVAETVAGGGLLATGITVALSAGTIAAFSLALVDAMTNHPGANGALAKDANGNIKPGQVFSTQHGFGRPPDQKVTVHDPELEAASLNAFRQGERTMATKIDAQGARESANQNRLQAALNNVAAKEQATTSATIAARDAILHQKTSFKAVTNVRVYTSVSVSELKRQARYSSRVARTTALSAS